MIRVGKVIKTYPLEGKVQVTFVDTKSSSLPLPMLACADMPHIGDYVITLHFDNGSSKGVCLGTYYGNGNVPPQPEPDPPEEGD